MFTSINSGRRGFTLIELLVVIAIIGILSSVVLASLGTARQKARDATRISDIKNVQLGLELYYDGRQAYPGNTSAAAFDAAALFTNAGWTTNPFVGNNAYIPVFPTDPSSRGAAFAYAYIGLDSAAALCQGAIAGNQPVACAAYRIGAALERTDNVVLAKDIDTNLSPFFGNDDAHCSQDAPVANTACYALQP
jgi:prepilin-type N-terminal cleavage/methylation domain-containing protein